MYLLFSLIPLLFLLTSCTSVRPVVKIGLIAPFEGLYRQSGYAALAAMRQALDECTPSGLAVIPLALDDSGDPAQAQRAAQKLLVDPTVRAVVGPLLLDAVPAVATVMAQEPSIPWLVPSLVEPAGGFAPLQTNRWLEEQVDFVATTTSATRILLLGLPAEWPLQINATVPLLRIDDLGTALVDVQEGDALLWLGRPDAGTRWLSALRHRQSEVDFWLVDQAGIDIFAAHAIDLHATHWLVWADVNYNQWSQSSVQGHDFPQYLTYRATCVALSSFDAGLPATMPAWELQSRPIERPKSDIE
jgi:branched-chain amino acid transport system substrate-binding protein